MNYIPTEVFCEQFNTLPLADLAKLGCTCTRMREILASDQFWQIRIQALFGSVNKLIDLSWQQLYSELERNTFIISYQVNNKQNRIALSAEKHNGLMALFNLYKQSNPQIPITTEFIREPFKRNKLTLLDSIGLIYTKPELSSLLSTQLKSDKVTPLEFYNLTYSKHELCSSFRRDGTPIKLPPYGKSKSVMSYICKYRDHFDSRNKIWQLKPEPKYLAILSSPEQKPWIIAIIRSEEFIEGIKLGCEILDLNYTDYLFATSEYKHYSRR